MSNEKTEMSIPDQWNAVVAELVEENFDLILENEGIEVEYHCYDDLPDELKCVVWKHQEEHIDNNFESYLQLFSK